MVRRRGRPDAPARRLERFDQLLDLPNVDILLGLRVRAVLVFVATATHAAGQAEAPPPAEPRASGSLPLGSDHAEGTGCRREGKN